MGNQTLGQLGHIQLASVLSEPGLESYRMFKFEPDEISISMVEQINGMESTLNACVHS